MDKSQYTGPECEMTWGEWVESRAYHVGLTNRRLLSLAVNVSERQLARWIKGKDQPRLHPANFSALARALRMGEDTLAEGWKLRSPQAVPIYEIKIELGDVKADDEIRREIGGIAQAVHGEFLLNLHRIAREIMANYLSHGCSSGKIVSIPPDPELAKFKKEQEKNRPRSFIYKSPYWPDPAEKSKPKSSLHRPAAKIARPPHVTPTPAAPRKSSQKPGSAPSGQE